jgi:hypothetical protein
MAMVGHLPAVSACHAQVDQAHPPPVIDILLIHHVENRGLIHVDGEGRQSIPIVDDGNNGIKVPLGLVAHFLGGALRGVVAVRWTRPVLP